MTWGGRGAATGMSGYIYTYARVYSARARGFIGDGVRRRGLDGTWTAHNSLFGSSLQFKKAFVSALLVISFTALARDVAAPSGGS